MKVVRSHLLIAAVLTLFISACSQTPALDTATNLTLQALPPGRALDLAKHSSGVYAVGVIGDFETPDFGREAFVRKYDPLGNRIWSKRFGALSRDTGATLAASDANSNLYVGGYTTGVLPGAVGSGGSFLRKYTPSGSVAWTRQNNYPASGLAVFGSSLYTAGSVTNTGGQDAYLRKYDTNGNVRWMRQFGTSGRDYAVDVAVSDTGFIYVVGTTAGTLAGSRGSGPLFIRKYNPAGGVQWTRQLARPESKAVAVSGNSVYVLGGDSYSPDIFDGVSTVYKLNTSGAVSWSKDYTLPTDADLSDLSADSTGVYLTGSFYTQDEFDPEYIFLAKLRPNGSPVWERLLGAEGASNSGLTVLAGGKNEVYVGGMANHIPFDDASYGDFYVGHVNGASGSTVWETP